MKEFPLDICAYKENPRFNQMVRRESELYKRSGDIRSEFMRDYTRIIHCPAFRRLKHKTQAFFSPQSDHICTRIEHVIHVESIGNTIAKALGLNTELVSAISLAHDLGHSPFGHKGEKILDEISLRDLGETFWHEKNGLFFVDRIELLEDDKRIRRNLDLTYAVRDGIISHCGEVGENGLIPRKEAVDLSEFDVKNKFMPFTFEGCTVKLADKISYVGRDIEDAVSLGVLDNEKLGELSKLLSNYIDTVSGKKLNNTILINALITDICLNSSPERGIAFSSQMHEMIELIIDFNNKNIYSAKRVKIADKYFKLVINEIYDTLTDYYDGCDTQKKLLEASKAYEMLPLKFMDWLNCYIMGSRDECLCNIPVFNLENRRDYLRAVLTYISGMTDKYAMDTYNEIISF
ncbi:MAG: HD domain-containing protein [Oscillospiraceae bacterium]|nr:HD domain-containing protein [Oscillospiraceae bacterium]